MRRLGIAVGLAAMTCGLLPGTCLAAAQCQAGREGDHHRVVLKRVMEGIRHGTLRILALGTAWTLGDAEWRKEQSYPALLNTQLRTRLPGVNVTVVNAGSDGLTAREMLSTLEEYLDTQRFSLVIWQVGIKDAMQNSGVEEFREAFGRGIEMAQEAASDVTLIHLPYSPQDEGYVGMIEYKKVIAETAKQRDVGLISIYSRAARGLLSDAVLSTYDCMASVVAGYLRKR